MEIVYPIATKSTYAELTHDGKLIAKLSASIDADVGTAFFIVQKHDKVRLMTCDQKLSPEVCLKAYRDCKTIMALPVTFNFYAHTTLHDEEHSFRLSFDRHRYGFTVRSDRYDENRMNLKKIEHFGEPLDQLYRLFDTSLVTRSVRKFFKQKEEERHV